MRIEQIAELCHEANRSYCAQLGDHSQLIWAEAPEWQRLSAIGGVKFHLKNPGAGPRGSHENWMYDKTICGWTYGAEKDPVKKTHPCMRPYDELPLEQRLKDTIFVALVHALAQHIEGEV